MPNQRIKRASSLPIIVFAGVCLIQEAHSFFASCPATKGASFLKHHHRSALMVYAPPGSGYATPDDEVNELPSDYKPMMGYPGSMRPGMTPENIPYQDLPVGDHQPLPIPWPFLQQVDFQHRFGPPHPQPLSTERFIEVLGRWASPEEEAEMRAGARQGIRERRERAEEEKKATLILDDEDDSTNPEEMELGRGVSAQLASPIEQTTKQQTFDVEGKADDIETDGAEEEDFDDFLLDLGLDAGSDESNDIRSGKVDEQEVSEEDSEPGTAGDSVGSDDTTSAITIGEDVDLDFDIDDDDDDLIGGGGMRLAPLEAFGDSSLLDDEDAFDDGGFDYDGGDGFFDGNDF